MCFPITVINFDRNLTFKSADIGEVLSSFISSNFISIGSFENLRDSIKEANDWYAFDMIKNVYLITFIQNY